MKQTWFIPPVLVKQDGKQWCMWQRKIQLCHKPLVPTNPRLSLGYWELMWQYTCVMPGGGGGGQLPYLSSFFKAQRSVLYVVDDKYNQPQGCSQPNLSGGK